MAARRWTALALAAGGAVLAGALAFGALGLRPPTPPSPEAPALTLTLTATAPIREILLVGTSLTSRGTWPAELEARLAACAPGTRVTRLARAGASSRWGLAALRRRLETGPPPDLLVVEFAINDAALARVVPLPLSRRHHREILALARAQGLPTVLATRNPAWGLQAMERPGQDRYYGLYRDLARAEGVGLIDTIPTWRALPEAQRQTWVPDGLHPTDAAMHEITVPALEKVLRPLVCPR